MTAAVGADAGFAFAPASLIVDAGTTVVWEWTGAGGAHNVVEKGGAFEYVCTPHWTRGMEGTIEVVEGD